MQPLFQAQAGSLHDSIGGAGVDVFERGGESLITYVPALTTTLPRWFGK